MRKSRTQLSTSLETGTEGPAFRRRRTRRPSMSNDAARATRSCTRESRWSVDRARGGSSRLRDCGHIRGTLSEHDAPLDLPHSPIDNPIRRRASDARVDAGARLHATTGPEAHQRRPRLRIVLSARPRSIACATDSWRAAESRRRNVGRTAASEVPCAGARQEIARCREVVGGGDRSRTGDGGSADVGRR